MEKWECESLSPGRAMLGYPSPGVWRLQHEVPPMPARQSAAVELLPGVRGAFDPHLRLVRHGPSLRIKVLQQLRDSRTTLGLLPSPVRHHRDLHSKAPCRKDPDLQEC